MKEIQTELPTTISVISVASKDSMFAQLHCCSSSTHTTVAAWYAGLLHSVAVGVDGVGHGIEGSVDMSPN